MPLTKAQKKFADLYIETGIPGESYMKAFRACKSKASASAAASRLLNKNHDVIEYVEMMERAATRAAIHKAEVSKENVLREEGLIAFVDPLDMLDENGQIRNLKDMPERVRRAISSIEVSTVAGSQVMKIKFWNKGQSLDRLEKCLQMQKDGIGDQKFTLKDIIEAIDGSGRGKLPSEQ